MAAVTTAPHVFTSGCFMLLKTGTLLTWHCQRHEKSEGTRYGMSRSSREMHRIPCAAQSYLESKADGGHGVEHGHPGGGAGERNGHRSEQGHVGTAGSSADLSTPQPPIAPTWDRAFAWIKVFLGSKIKELLKRNIRIHLGSEKNLILTLLCPQMPGAALPAHPGSRNSPIL